VKKSFVCVQVVWLGSSSVLSVSSCLFLSPTLFRSIQFSLLLFSLHTLYLCTIACVVFSMLDISCEWEIVGLSLFERDVGRGWLPIKKKRSFTVRVSTNPTREGRVLIPLLSLSLSSSQPTPGLLPAPSHRATCRQRQTRFPILTSAPTRTAIAHFSIVPLTDQVPRV